VVDAGIASCVTPAPECDPPGTYFCEGEDVMGCNANGEKYLFKECPDGQYCGVEGNAVVCVVDIGPIECETPGQTWCDGAAILTCSATFKIVVEDACGDGTVCALHNGSLTCVPGAIECDGGACVCVPEPNPTCVIALVPGTVAEWVPALEIREACAEEPVTVLCGGTSPCEDGACISSVADPESPYWEASCPLEQQLAIKTNLVADCRCFTNQAPSSGIDLCKRPQDVAKLGVQVGPGPSLYGWNNVRVNGGFIDAANDRLVAAVSWGGSSVREGLVMGFDLTTGERTPISGDWSTAEGKQTIGAGHPLDWAIDVRPGPDGKLYAFADVATAKPEIVQVDPETGDRTLVWRGRDEAFGQCASGSGIANQYVQYTSLGFAVEPAGTFLVGFANAVVDGRGLVRIAADGSTCEWVTVSGTRPDKLVVGTGDELGGMVQGYTLHGGQIWAQTTQPKALWSIDPATGNREVALLAQAGGIIGERWSVWDEGRGVMWTAGLQSSVTIAAVNLETKAILDIFATCGEEAFPWFPLCASGPIQINSQNYGGIWMHPKNGNLIVAQDAIGIVEVEIATGNSIIISL
jgi:hypothetical protein